MKSCINCGKLKELEDYYVHPKMKDGHLNKCKACCKLHALKNRYKNIEYYKEYDKSRFMNPERVRGRQIYAESEAGQNAQRLANARWVILNPEKRAAIIKKWNDANKEKRSAQGKVSTALKNGKLLKKNCQICDNIKSQAHHKDYNRPLDVEWLCATCHANEHIRLKAEIREANG